MKNPRETLETLEFSVVRRMLAERSVTPMGGLLASELAPIGPGEQIAAALDETAEALRLLEETGGPPLRGIGPVVPILETIRPEGSVLGGREILETAGFASVVEGARLFGRKHAAAFPILGRRAESLPVLAEIVERVAGKIASSGELEDAASPELARIRGRIHGVTASIRRTLEGILARTDADRFLSDAFITERGGRFVIPVRSDSPLAPRGIVHGGSSSGATLFVEPIATVEPNNELVRLREDEAEETARILRAWTEMLRERLDDLLRAADVMGRLDLAIAKGRLAKQTRSVRPELAEGNDLVLRAARHPLLESTLAASGARMVPIDLALPPGTSTLIVSGPNAGGKTVVLKTTGLLALMAHAGLFVPAAEVRLPILTQILVDIGDRQSIEGSLSTFSAHIQNLSAMTRTLDPPALVLIDEIGTGTDPAEGGALAISLLEWLRRHGALTIATTHHGPVKIYGIETPGVGSAAVEFDETTLAPTYRLLSGIAGASSGLAIAERLGLDLSIVAEARSRIDPGAREAEAYLLRLRGMVAALEEDRRELERLRSRVEEEGRRAREAAIRSDHERAEKFRGELGAALEEFRKKARDLATGLADRREEIRLDRERIRREAELRREHEALARAAAPAEALPGGRSGRGRSVRAEGQRALRGAAGGLPGPAGGGGSRLVKGLPPRAASEDASSKSRRGATARFESTPPGGGEAWAGEDGFVGDDLLDTGPVEPFVPRPGARVLVGPYGREGRVESVEENGVMVLVGSARFRVRPEDCLPPEGSEPSSGTTTIHRAAADSNRTGPTPASGRRGVAASSERRVSDSFAADALDGGISPYELNLIGLVVEEGLERLDKFLDDAYLSGRREVRIVHGHGTGRLRTAVRDFLTRHPHVASHRPGAPNEGGNGATVAKLRE